MWHSEGMTTLAKSPDSPSRVSGLSLDSAGTWSFRIAGHSEFSILSNEGQAYSG